MSAELYQLMLGVAGLLYLLVFFCSIYVWRISSLRLVWLGVGGATLLSSMVRFVAVLDMESSLDLTASHSWLYLIDVLIPVLLLSGAGLALPVIKAYNSRLELAEENQKALEESEGKYRELIESTGAGYVILDAEANVLECNEAYIQLIGRSSADEVVGHNLVEWVDESEKGAFVVDEMARHSECELRIYDGLT